MKEIILVGGGGHCRSCIDIIEANREYKIGGIIDLKEKIGQEISGYKIIGTDEDLASLMKRYKYYLITIGQIKSAIKRKSLYALLKASGAIMPAIISSQAYVSRRATIGEGTIVMNKAFINAGAKIGDNCIINSGAIIEHDVLVGDHCHISTGAIINGGSVVKEGSFVGSNATVREGIVVGRDSLIGAACFIKSDLKDNSFVKAGGG